MADPIKHALTRKHIQRGRLITQEPSQTIVLTTKFALTITAVLTALQVTHLAF
jgi:hypothetical protein